MKVAVRNQRLLSYVEKIMKLNHSSASALVVLKDNEIVLEHYDGFHSNLDGSLPITKSSKFNIASARKSYLGLAIALALYEKKIKSIDDYARDYFDGHDIELLANTTIRHLVTHSHGLHEKEDGTVFREFDAGQGWVYRGINVSMMTQLFNRLYGKSFPQVLRERVFEPLGLYETAWYTNPETELVKVIDNPNEDATYKLGNTDDGSCSNLHTTARDFALWGNLHVNKGYLNGKQIVPKEVIQLATSVQSPNYNDKVTPLNGLFWYVQEQPTLKSEIGDRVPKGSFQILGVTGPTLLVIPKHNLVVAKMYNKRYNYGGENYLHYLREFSNIVADTYS